VRFLQSKSQPDDAFLCWSRDGDHLGIPRFDLEHERLAEVICDIHSAVAVKRDRDFAYKLMEKLIQQTREHFDHEEAAMQEAFYTGLKVHAAEHQALIEEAKEMLRKFQTGAISALFFPMRLKTWLVKHVKDADRKYVSYIRR
jgi:hemerythrin-like metal-binding protein